MKSATGRHHVLEGSGLTVCPGEKRSTDRVLPINGLRKDFQDVVLEI